jgi:hypothetical protein
MILLLGSGIQYDTAAGNRVLSATALPWTPHKAPFLQRRLLAFRISHPPPVRGYQLISLPFRSWSLGAERGRQIDLFTDFDVLLHSVFPAAAGDTSREARRERLME